MNIKTLHQSAAALRAQIKYVQGRIKYGDELHQNDCWLGRRLMAEGVTEKEAALTEVEAEIAKRQEGSDE